MDRLVRCLALAGTVALVSPTSVATGGSTAPMPQLSSHLEIVSAVVTEVLPFDLTTVPGRSLLFEIVLAAEPTCDGATTSQSFGFLIDADSDPTTGTTDPAFDDLGVDARVSAVCDPGTQSYVSAVGTVSVSTDSPGGETTIQILTTVDQLPSVAFDWVAFAFDNAELGRLPEAPGHAFWATTEIIWP